MARNTESDGGTAVLKRAGALDSALRTTRTVTGASWGEVKATGRLAPVR